MAGQDRLTSDALRARLAAGPHAFDLFALMRRIEAAYADRPRIGRSRRLGEDAVRFGQSPSLAFAPSSVDSVEPAEGTRPDIVRIHAFGLLGPNGPLPLHITEYIRDRVRNAGDRTLERFLDVFHHRMISLFYRSWAQCSQTASFDRPETDRFAAYIASTLGVGIRELAGRDAVPDNAKLFFASRLMPHTRSADGLAAVISGYFGVGCEVQEFVGRWMRLPEDSRCRVGASRRSGLLGVNAIVGESMWECQGQFRLRLGPMGLADYESFLPGGRRERPFADWVKNYIGWELEYDIRLVLRAAEVPETRLGRAGRLGYTTWLGRRPPATDADDLVLKHAS